MKRILFVFLLFSVFSLSAQKATTRIVVCLYDRVDFNTDYLVSEIGFINNVKQSEVYDSLITILGKQLENQTNKDVIFEVLSPQESYYFSKNGKKYAMKNPSRHGIDLSGIDGREYQVFMDLHKADYLLFINYYQVDKYRISEEDVESFKRSIPSEQFYLFDQSTRKRPLYSQHKIDFDVFDFYKKRVLSKGGFALPVFKYQITTFYEKGLGFRTIEKSYTELAKNIWNEFARVLEEARAETEAKN